MESKERTFLEITKRFFEPMKQSIPISIRAILTYSLWGINPIIHIVFIQLLTSNIEWNNYDMFIKIVSFYWIYIVLYEVIEFSVRRWWWVESVNSFRIFIHSIYVKRYISLESNTMEGIGTWKMIALIDKWMDTWALSLDKFLLEFFYLLFSLIFSCYIAFKVNPIYWASFLILYFFVFGLVVKVNWKSLFYRRKREEHQHIYIKKLIKIIMSKFEVLQTNRIDNEISSLNKSSFDLYKSSWLMAPYVHLSYRIPESFVALSQLFILFYVGAWVIKWNLSLSLFVWVFWVFTLMWSTMTRATRFFREFTKDFTKIEKLWDFFDNTPQISWYDTWKDFVYKSWIIELKNISYAYNKDKYVFKDFNLKIKGWVITALVWHSWSGKSTLAKLISGYIKANSWDIIIDSQKLSETSLKTYYKNIWYLTQEPSVFDWTILENLTYAIDYDVENNEIEKIIKLAKCEFIYDLPNWLETEIGERWIRLSWWQNQRLAIAKIMLKNPKIIILDEPTSALDSFSEEKISESLNNLFAWRTVIVIAHRLQTVKHADDIIVLENWKIIERWTHKDLIKQKWHYKKMLDLQSGF